MELTPPDHHLRRLVVALSRSECVIPPDVASWLTDGIAEFCAHGGRKALCVCLGLRGRGVRSLASKEKQRRRDAVLHLLVALAHDGQPRTLDWRANHLVERAKQFERRRWPQLKHLDTPPARLNELDRRLFLAMRDGHKIPATRGYLVALVRGKPPLNQK